MMKIKIKITRYCCVVLLMISCTSLAQKRNNIWCFGDSAGINFNNISNPVPVSTSLNNRGSCVSISDTSGNLLFYGNTNSNNASATSGQVWNQNHQLMLQGDSIAGIGWYEEMVIVPDPADDSLYFLFSIGVTLPFGLMYSVIDMRGDSGLGAVVQKNISLSSGYLVDCLTAIKHGNGRDWWVITRESTFIAGTGNNIWNLYLIASSGITTIPTQQIGSLNSTNSGSLCFNSNVNKLTFTNLGGMIEIYDFDRCTGQVSNPTLVEPQPLSSPYSWYWSCEFSTSGQYLYVSSSTQISRLWQFDVWAANIAASKTLIWQVQNPANTAGALKRGPNNKIYFSCAWVGGGFNYLNYNSTQYYLENMNLSVINSPDSAGAACDFQPWSFYLGGKRTYWGLPNNPDYDLGPLVGSPCDTLTSLNETAAAVATVELYVYYSPQWQTAFINSDKLKGTSYRLSVYDLMGKEVFSERGKITPPYFTKNLNCGGWAKGMYVVSLESDSYRTSTEKLVKKFVVE